MTNMPTQESLRKYAEVIVKVGLNLRKGQRLIITNNRIRGVSVTNVPLVREVVRAAYQAGARFVDVIWSDEELLRIRLENTGTDTLKEFPVWQINAQMNTIENDGALLTILSENPDLMNGLDPEAVGALQKYYLENYAPVGNAVSRPAMNWCLVAASAPDWAAKVFPEVERSEAEARLWEAIFQTTRVDLADPVAAWQDHIQALLKRSGYLQSKQYTALHYKAPGTDLTLGLPRGHKWISARMPAENGVDFTANLPTEEVFSMPDRLQAEGTVRATMPLSYGGSLIEDFSVTFKKGRITEVHAERNEAALRKIVETDEGASHLGEVALVTASSPIARRGHLFFNTLFDENASCHIAIGRAYRFTLEGGEAMSEAEFEKHGGNTSLTHVDFMIGSAEMDIDGVKEDGSAEPVMRSGEWAFDV